MLSVLSVMLLIGRLLLAAVFAVAGLAKLADLAGSRKSLIDFGVPGFLTAPGAVLLPLLELACAVALLRANWAWAGAAGALVLLLAFIGGIGVSLIRGRRPDCHCFGQLYSTPVGWTTLARNTLLAGLAAFIVSQGSSVVPVFSLADVLISEPSATRLENLVLGLAIAAIALALFELWAIVHLLRQNGRLLVRIDALEAKLGVVSGQSQPARLPIGAEAPAFELAGLDGDAATLGNLGGRGVPLLLVFIEPGCGACDALLPEVALWQREYADRLFVVPISRGDSQVNRAKSIRHGLNNMLLQSDREVASAYRVGAAPSAVLVKDGLIVSALETGADAIRGLVARATAPAPLQKGDRVPSLRLPDLNGGTLDLATLLGRRTLLLFWNPACGLCQQMLDDLKAWEAGRHKDAPDLVVVSAGSRQANREQGFRSHVVLDPKSFAWNLFGAGGTPSALLLDEQGRVASDVGVGAPAVLALAGAVPVGSSVPA